MFISSNNAQTLWISKFNIMLVKALKGSGNLKPFHLKVNRTDKIGILTAFLCLFVGNTSDRSFGVLTRDVSSQTIANLGSGTDHVDRFPVFTREHVV